MIDVIEKGVYLLDGKEFANDTAGLPAPDRARENTITYRILRAHDADGGKGNRMRIRFDAMMSHDITYVGTYRLPARQAWRNSPCPMP